MKPMTWWPISSPLPNIDITHQELSLSLASHFSMDGERSTLNPRLKRWSLVAIWWVMNRRRYCFIMSTASTLWIIQGDGQRQIDLQNPHHLRHSLILPHCPGTGFHSARSFDRPCCMQRPPCLIASWFMCSWIRRHEPKPVVWKPMHAYYEWLAFVCMKILMYIRCMERLLSVQYDARPAHKLRTLHGDCPNAASGKCNAQHSSFAIDTMNAVVIKVNTWKSLNQMHIEVTPVCTDWVMVTWLIERPVQGNLVAHNK